VLTTDADRRLSISFSSPMRTRVVLGSTSPISFKRMTSSSSAPARPQRAVKVEHAAAGQVGRTGQGEPLIAAFDQRLEEYGRDARHRAAPVRRAVVDERLHSGGASTSFCPASFSLTRRRSSVTSSPGSA